jgi:hypothetical protein
MWGGYDYAKLMKKVQFIEAYNLGSSQAIIRSFNPHNAVPQVTTHFHKDQRGTANDIWQTWYYFAHGNRGMIGWVDGWFDGKTPRPWLKEYRRVNLEIGGRQGPKMVGARWRHDGVAIYYSHPSIQVSWCLDIEPHGRTWVNRGSDHKLGTSHNVRRAWENLLTDSGIQYSFVPYDEVVVNGVPAEFKVLILPACYALSDAEAQQFRKFCEAGGTLIADFAPGIFDQYGKGREQGALDDLLGVEHGGDLTKRRFFGGKLWVETDQDRGFYYKTYKELFATVSCPLADGFAVAVKGIPVRSARQVGRGRAVLLNLSPQRYLQYREEGRATDAHRAVFVEPVRQAGVNPWLRITGPDGKRPPNTEATYWTKDGRMLVFVLQNVPVSGSAFGGGGAEGLVERQFPIQVEFPAEATDLVNERSGKKFGNGRRFTFDLNTVEAVFFSFSGDPRRGEQIRR